MKRVLRNLWLLITEPGVAWQVMREVGLWVYLREGEALAAEETLEELRKAVERWQREH